jgi:hypothetical protein
MAHSGVPQAVPCSVAAPTLACVLHGPFPGWNVKLMSDVHCREMTSGGLLRSLHCTQKVIAA